MFKSMLGAELVQLIESAFGSIKSTMGEMVELNSSKNSGYV